MFCREVVALSPDIFLSPASSTLRALRSTLFFPPTAASIILAPSRDAAGPPRMCLPTRANASSPRIPFQAWATARGRLGDWAPTGFFPSLLLSLGDEKSDLPPGLLRQILRGKTCRRFLVARF